nr:hypothetical protein [Tanacetum cinerariifolium]
MRTHSSSNLVGESSPNPTTSNPKRHNRRRSKQPFILEESLVDTIVDQRTMAELLRVPIEGYAEKVNDVTRLQALVDRKKVIITEATIRDALCLDDAEGIECLPNEQIFAELARMGYDKPSTKLTFYKAFFLSQCKFLIHTILQCMSAKRTSWNEFSSFMASVVICLSIGPLPSNTIANLKEEDEHVEETLTDLNLSEYTIKVPPPLV